MKKLSLLIAFVFCACAILEPPKQEHFADLKSYTHAYINTTSTLNSGVGGGAYGYYGGGSYSVSKSVNPMDIIAGILMKKGLIIINNIDENTGQTLMVSYGQGARRDVLGGLGGYTLEVSIQILNAKTKEPVYFCTAEGQGSTEADDIRKAIHRCLDGL